mgnify:CR=1 FL=1
MKVLAYIETNKKMKYKGKDFCRLTLHNEQRFRATVFETSTKINIIRYSTVLIRVVFTATLLLHDMHSSLSFFVIPQLTSRQRACRNERAEKKKEKTNTRMLSI